MSKNVLSNEKSLYLKQHADHPIHWRPYQQKYFQEAQNTGKLLFISIGYSSCHWCHVMAEESFSDEKVGEFLNEHFISLKIDREEFPDLDHYFQKISSIVNGRGGWPLNIFLTPEGKPFFAGTYFPKISRKDLPSFFDLIQELQTTWVKNKEALLGNAQKISEILEKGPERPKKVEYQGHFPSPHGVLNALSNFADKEFGGYGQAPKFPHFPFLEWAAEQILEGMIPKELGEHIVYTVEKMMMGGLFDQLKGGIHRYSVDQKYLVPHFEKMLYDQAGLLRTLSKVSQFYPSPLFFDGILQTLDYLRSEMLAEQGYFFSAQDADSEGVEGLYFTFSKEEFEQSFEDAPAEQKIKLDQYLEWFNITEKGVLAGQQNVISLNSKFKDKFYSEEGLQELRDIKRRLLEQRKMRIPPATDSKGVASWNFLIISALCDVVQYCPIVPIKEEASRLIESTFENITSTFVKTHDQGSPLINTIQHATTVTNHALYLEDYVCFAESQLRLYEVFGHPTSKENLLQTMEFISKTFIEDQSIKMSSFIGTNQNQNQKEKQQEEQGLTNQSFKQEAALFDESFKSSAMSLILLLSKISLWNDSFAPENILGKEKLQEYIQFILSNPLSHGEGLRSFTYPQEIFRKIEVPRSWIKNGQFVEMQGHYFSRFLLDYHDRDDESYQICKQQECEISGQGFESFMQVFAPPKVKPDESKE